ncbi:MlaD family protein [Methylovorus glucosotrophus]|jgi:phospholipid/cholesterol/gamma-HCH transport system substrate-binding protein|uniref:Mammalian cell entry related domain protein n=1 Tax=Methylovorus glucosotrophus (strain SIP3-4) TaxID=582744 RepID=C6XAC9_METGS|nr:MlaD family protein [Methylovorus glucosotrophus]ACT51670.1 Mammalian cell entry related domain protein [Methylovorus glucosotrophus SIP3-4]
MENRSHAIAVGLFTLILGLAAIFAFWWLSGSREEKTHYTINSNRPVSGLNPEASVKFRGVEVGKVLHISLDDNTQNDIHVEIEVTKTLQLSKAAYAELRLQGVTGLAYIDLNDDGSSQQRLGPDDTIPLRPSFVDRFTEHAPEIIEQVETLVKSSSQLAATAHEMVQKIDTDQLNRTIANLEKASAQLEPLLRTSTATMNRLGSFASERNRQQLESTLQSLQQTSDAVRPLMDTLGQSARDFSSMTGTLTQSSQQLSDSLQQDTLPRLNALTDSLQRDSQQFEQLMETLEDHPQSLLLGKPKAQPGPGEAGFKP